MAPGARVTLRLSGPTVQATRTELWVPPCGLHVKMYAPSTAKTILGLLLTSIAAGPLVTGSAFTVMSRVGTDGGDRRGELAVGVGLIAVGGAALVAGTTLFGLNHRGVAWRSDGVRF